MWMPPLPDGVLDPPARPGLRITYADVDADALEAHIRHYYTDRAALEFIVDGDDVDREVRLLAEDATGLLSRYGSA